MQAPSPSWPTDKIERRKVAALIPNARNARTHTQAQVEQIAASIRQWGWTVPVLVDETETIIAGHGRLLAAGLLGIGDVPVIVARGWSDEQKRAYVIADNKLTENGGWDIPTLRLEIGELDALGFNLPLDRLLGGGARELSNVRRGGRRPLEESRGMPEFQQGDKTAFRSIVVHFKDQKAVDDFANRIGQPISDKTRFIWLPEIEIERCMDKQYAAANGS